MCAISRQWNETLELLLFFFFFGPMSTAEDILRIEVLARGRMKGMNFMQVA